MTNLVPFEDREPDISPFEINFPSAGLDAGDKRGEASKYAQLAANFYARKLYLQVWDGTFWLLEKGAGNVLATFEPKKFKSLEVNFRGKPLRVRAGCVVTLRLEKHGPELFFKVLAIRPASVMLQPIFKVLIDGEREMPETTFKAALTAVYLPQ